MKPNVIQLDPWTGLRRFTDARIALGRAGVSLPTQAQLEFQLAHARARDAVHARPDWDEIETGLAALGLQTLRVSSKAADRSTYLQRPDLGRRLDDKSIDVLRACSQALNAEVMEQAEDGADICFDVAFVVADGLSAYAVQRQAPELMAAVLPLLQAERWRIAPVALVNQGRVAVGDEIGALLKAAIVVVLVGERPGLSSPDSLGIYFTHTPRPGMTDATRNCISNVRPAGLPAPAAAHKLCYLLSESRRRKISGVALKDDAEVELNLATANRNFLTAD